MFSATHLLLQFKTVVPKGKKLPEGVIWAKVKTCSSLNERWNYSHVTSSKWTNLAPN
jgi:hypothetical protein